MAKKRNDRADQDSPWKTILRLYFPQAIEFFFPKVAAEIDWKQPIEFLDKEFQQLTPDSEIGKRFADQLVKAYSKSGESLLLLIHLEVQAAPELAFPERMFIYMRGTSDALYYQCRRNWLRSRGGERTARRTVVAHSPSTDPKNRSRTCALE
jgi:hypothetical protein